VMNDDLDLKNCEPVVTGKNDKAFLVIRVKGLTNVSEKKIDQLKKAGYSVMVLDFDDDEAAQQLDDKVLLARIMSVVHWSVFGVAEQWNICAVDQPPVEFYKKIVDWMRLKKANFTRTIKAITESRYAATKDEITLNWHAMVQRGLFTEEELINELEALSAKTGRALNIFDPAHVSAAIHSIALKKGDIEYGELAHSGETSYTKDGLAMRDVLNHGDDVLWRKTLKKFADVGKLPGSGHAYHAMIKAAQKCLTTSLIGMNHLEQFKNSNVKYSSDYLKMHWLGNLLALSGYDIKREDGQKLEDGKLVAKDKPGWAMSLIFDENNEDTRHALKAYFDEVADILEKARPSILDTIEKRSKVLDSSM